MADMYGLAQDNNVFDDTDADDVSPADEPTDADGATEGKAGEVERDPAEEALVKRIQSRIRADRKHFEKAFKRMDDSMFMAMHGRDRSWSEKNYKANIAGRHVKTKTAAIYAKNPKVVARRKDTMDFTVWDETKQSLQIALEIYQQGLAMQQAALAAPPQPLIDGATGQPVLDPVTGQPAVAPPPVPPGFAEAEALIKDFQQGMAKRQLIKKFGRTLEIVFADAMRQQTPNDFKTSMKSVVRRAATTSVGYVELGFQRKYGVPSATTERLADFRTRLEHIRVLAEKAAEDEFDQLDAERAELEAAITALEQEPQIVLRSGLTFDFMLSTRVIPDRMCTSLVGFVGARHLTLEYLYTVAEVREIFNYDLGHRYTPYTLDGDRAEGYRGVDYGDGCNSEGVFGAAGKDDDLVCVYKHYDRVSGLVYHLVDGHPHFIKKPSAPDVSVPRFWPDYALTFNEVESETELFPPSDVELLADMQMEVNRSRQGKREHRNAARPRWGYANGAFDTEKDVPNLESLGPFEMVGLNKDPAAKLADILEPFPVPGVDPNLYDTGEVMTDAQLTVGAQAAQLGGLAKATATEAAIAEGSSSTTDGSSIDDLDAFLTAIARDGGRILMMNMTKEEVVKIAGAGAVWVEDLVEQLGVTPEDVYEEIYLEIEAGSTGKPNQALEIRNIKEVGPILLQLPDINPEWLAKEMLRRFDDRMDLTEAVVSGIPAIVAQNRMAQPATGDPASDPTQQGEKGGDKSPAPGGPTGSDAPMGGNQTP